MLQQVVLDVCRLASNPSVEQQQIIVRWLGRAEPLLNSMSGSMDLSIDLRIQPRNIALVCLMVCRHERKRLFQFSTVRFSELETYDDYIPYGPMPQGSHPPQAKSAQYFRELVDTWNWLPEEVKEFHLLFGDIQYRPQTRFLLDHLFDVAEQERQGVNASALVSILVDYLLPDLSGICVTYLYGTKIAWEEWNTLMNFSLLNKKGLEVGLPPSPLCLLQ